MIIYSHDIARELDAALAAIDYDHIFLLTDETTEQLCKPLLQGSKGIKSATPIVIGATDTHKNIDTLCLVWKAMVEGGASRKSLLVNLGGGMVTDLGGFAAASFKRGIRYLNIPTTLLSMVDAAVGGKTGINFNGLKNEIGAFRDSEAVIIDTTFLRTLDAENLRSGYAEMLKHAFLDSEEMWSAHLAFDLEKPDFKTLQTLVKQSIDVKSHIVEIDPHERGLRKALNLGHTVGHAFESLALKQNRPMLHGYAVAYGLVCELYLSCLLSGFPESKMRQTFNFVRQYYGTFRFTCDDYPALLELMQHDKKNTDGVINFTLLEEAGQLRLDSHATEAQIKDMFDFYTNV